MTTLLLACAVVVIVATASTTDARFAAQTSNQNNLWSAARLDVRIDSAEQLFLDGTGLYPGLQLENCFRVHYSGSVSDVSVRLHATDVTGGLAHYFDLTVETGQGTATDCSDFQPDGNPRFQGTIREFADQHGTFGTGLLLADSVDDGQSLTVRASGSVVDDNRAQGQDGRLVAIVEARP